jgi:HPr kinase/phosphorylase
VTEAPDGPTIHATCVVVGEAGVLIRGASGAGKSTLARRIVVASTRAGLFGRLVGDDRVRIAAAHGRLVARPAAAIAGRIEIRGVGLTGVAHEAAAVVRLLVDLLDQAPARMPGAEGLGSVVSGVALPLLALPFGEGLEDLVLWRLAGLRHGTVTD